MPTGPSGPNIDPPYPQGRVRPFGVYRYPDPRNAERTIFEAWDEHGECVFVSSVTNRRATARTEVAAWAFLDESDIAPAVNESPRPRAAFLRRV